MKSTLFFTAIILANIVQHSSTLAQSIDSTAIIIYDTIDVYKEPLIIKKTIILPSSTNTEKNSKNKLYILYKTGLNYQFSYHDVCESCKELYDRIQASTTPKIGYSGGIEILFNRNRLFVSAEFLSQLSRESFNFKDSTNSVFQFSNKLNNYDFSGGIGYALNKNTKRQLIISLNYRHSTLSKVNGYSPDSSSQKYIVPITSIHSFRKSTPGLTFMLKYKFPIYKSFTIIPEAGCSVDLKSIVDNKGPFTIQRATPFVRIAIGYGF